jgi:MerR family transcriptional regulator, thiopeptide resistance regulator
MTDLQPIIPVLVCEDIAAEHAFLVEAFGFEAGDISHDPDGDVIHGEVRFGGSAIWLHRVSPAHELVAPGTLAAQGGGLVVHVPDVDAHHAHASAAGARIDAAPADRPYGLREYGAHDPEGHRWWFGTPLAE